MRVVGDAPLQGPFAFSPLFEFGLVLPVVVPVPVPVVMPGVVLDVLPGGEMPDEEVLPPVDPPVEPVPAAPPPAPAPPPPAANAQLVEIASAVAKTIVVIFMTSPHQSDEE